MFSNTISETHLFALSFFPALLTGLINAKFKHRVAELVWLVPGVILAYKLFTFPHMESVLVHGYNWPALHHYFGGGFLIPTPHANTWKDFWSVVGPNPDMIRGMDQLTFTAPFYAGLGYSVAAWIGRRTDLSRKVMESLNKWEEQRFGDTQASE